MAQGAAEIERLLRARGFALTSQRRAIVRHLAEHGGHWTPTQLRTAVTGSFPMASRATVYATLALLRDLGVLQEVLIPGGERRFDTNPGPHHHFLCRTCGQLEDLPIPSLAVRFVHEGEPPFQVERFSVIAEGLCGSCR
ncbi:MAG TPA: Fur family transcriptional regulator [Myxococcota bacterium]|nr:Fur family transcriptional regulator [Myxococcota bacterium]